MTEDIKDLERKLRAADERLRACSGLLGVWKMYSSALKSIGRVVPEARPGLHELKEAIKRLENECLDALGEEGLKLLRFLGGEEDFPREISVGDIRKTLEIFRPILVKSFREEG